MKTLVKSIAILFFATLSLTSCSNDDNDIIMVHNCEPKTETLRIRVDTQDNILQVLNFSNAWLHNMIDFNAYTNGYEPANPYISVARNGGITFTAAGTRKIKKITTPAFPQVYDNLNHTVFTGDYGNTQLYFDNTDIIEFYVTMTIE